MIFFFPTGKCSRIKTSTCDARLYFGFIQFVMERMIFFSISKCPPMISVCILLCFSYLLCFEVFKMCLKCVFNVINVS